MGDAALYPPADRTCPIPGCPVRINADWPACPDHWHRLTPSLRNQLRIAFGSGVLARAVRSRIEGEHVAASEADIALLDQLIEQAKAPRVEQLDLCVECGESFVVHGFEQPGYIRACAGLVRVF